MTRSADEEVTSLPTVTVEPPCNAIVPLPACIHVSPVMVNAAPAVILTAPDVVVRSARADIERLPEAINVTDPVELVKASSRYKSPDVVVREMVLEPPTRTSLLTVMLPDDCNEIAPVVVASSSTTTAP